MNSNAPLWLFALITLTVPIITGIFTLVGVNKQIAAADKRRDRDQKDELARYREERETQQRQWALEQQEHRRQDQVNAVNTFLTEEHKSREIWRRQLRTTEATLSNEEKRKYRQASIISEMNASYIRWLPLQMRLIHPEIRKASEHVGGCVHAITGYLEGIKDHPTEIWLRETEPNIIWEEVFEAEFRLRKAGEEHLLFIAPDKIPGR